MKTQLLQAALEAHSDDVAQPLAIVITGNPRYINHPKAKSMALVFYADISKRLAARGYAVEFDAGKDYTVPREGAAVWIGHSRGIDRLRFAPEGVKTIALQTMDHTKVYINNDERGLDPAHYTLSAADIAAIEQL